IAVARTLHDVYKMLKAQQNRGQEAAGISVLKEDGTLDVIKWMGLVDDFALDYLYDILGDGVLFEGHIRYSTSGSKSSLRNAHPHYLGGRETEHSDHLIARGVDASIVHNGTLACCPGAETVDCDSMFLLETFMEIGGEGVLQEIPGAYSAAILTPEGATVLRDRYGIRPLSIGKKDGRYVAASEDCAIREIGGSVHRTFFPGEMGKMTRTDFQTERIVPSNDKMCFFELNYLMNDESHFIERSVRDGRYILGGVLCDEFFQATGIDPNEIDVIAYLPKCPEPAALGFADRIRKYRSKPLKVHPKDNIYYKKKKRRAFMGQSQKQRKKSIQHNLYLRDNVDLDDLVILIIDDSIVRGNNSKRAVRMVNDAGAKKVYFAAYTPPIGPIKNGIGRGCLFGVDMPPSDDFATRKYKTIGGVAEYIRAEKVYYLSKEGMFKAIRIPMNRTCHYCIGGPHPMEDYIQASKG
ncbi:MAG: hypothetical protein ACE5FW_03315, partial [Candidatus Aenigmatarchaeota archaeon]